MSDVVATAQQGLAGKYKQYPQYKDSGVEWLGDVPSSWSTCAIWMRFSIGRGRVISNEEIHKNQGDYPVYSSQTLNDGIMGSLDTYDFDGDYITWTTDGANAGTVFTRSGKFNCTNVCGTLRAIDSAKTNLRFYTYALSVATSWFVRHDINPKLMNNVMGAIKVPVVHEAEQHIIAAFLDYETARIDRLIAQQQRLIELLKEKRQAVISHAVTKGINPDAPMKDSGVEWLGQVPKHWVVSPLKYKCEFSGGGTPSKDNLEYWNGSIPWVSPKDMKSFWITDAEDKITEQAIKESSTKLVQPGAVLMVVRSGILQRTIPVGMNTIPVTMNQDMKAIRFSSAVYAEWLSFFIKGYEDSLLLDWRKQGATVESIEHEYLANSLMLFPPEEEARSIIAALGRRLDKFDQLEQRASDAITLLQERRTALISAAVTGKIDLRGWTQPAEEVAA